MIFVERPTFRKQYARLPHKVRVAFHERIRIFTENPFDPILGNHPIRGKHAGRRSINITGDYRLIFEEQEEVIFLILIGRHRDLYDE